MNIKDIEDLQVRVGELERQMAYVAEVLDRISDTILYYHQQIEMLSSLSNPLYTMPVVGRA